MQNLQKKAQIKPKGVFGWHIGRKLFMRTCAELGITSWNAKLMCGKAVDKSIATYINGLQLKNDAEKVHRVLAMETTQEENNKISNMEETIKALEKENITFKTRIDLMQKTQMKQEEDIEKLILNVTELKCELAEAITGIKKPIFNVENKKGMKQR